MAGVGCDGIDTACALYSTYCLLLIGENGAYRNGRCLRPRNVSDDTTSVAVVTCTVAIRVNYET